MSAEKEAPSEKIDELTAQLNQWRPFSHSAGTQTPTAAHCQTSSTQTLETAAASGAQKPKNTVGTQTTAMRVHNTSTQTASSEITKELYDAVMYTELGTITLPEFAEFKLPEPTQEQQRQLEQRERAAREARQQAQRQEAQRQAAAAEAEEQRYQAALAKAVPADQQLAERRHAFVAHHNIDLARKKLKELQIIKTAVREVIQENLRAQVVQRLLQQVAMDEDTSEAIASGDIRDITEILKKHAQDIAQDIEAAHEPQQQQQQQRAVQEVPPQPRTAGNNNSTPHKSPEAHQAGTQQTQSAQGHRNNNNRGRQWYKNAYDAPGMSNLREYAMKMLLNGKWQAKNDDQRELYRRAVKEEYEKRMERAGRR